MKKLFLALFTILALTACGSEDPYNCGAKGEQCHVTGEPGPAGKDGKNGADGKAGTNGVNGATGKAGKDGSNGIDGTNGVDGQNGTDGTNGVAGQNGADGVNGTNGVDGAQGPQGVAGQNGTNGVNGAPGQNGSNGVDGVNGTNGQNGTNGVNGRDAVLSSGPVGSWVSGKSYSACHHDYTYLSNGWLLFRHQANGTADQGVGTTGFDVWNVDIADFRLISETGNVTYCTLHFDRNALTLTGVVNDNSDGLAGTAIDIDL